MEDGNALKDEEHATESLPLRVWLSVPIVAALLVYSVLIPGFLVRAAGIALVSAIIIACLRRTYAEGNDQTGK